MNHHADTCLLLSFVFRDSGTPAALAWLEGAGADPVVISRRTIVEFVSAAGIMALRGDLSPKRHRERLERFRRLVAARLTTATPSVADFDRASIWIENYRSGLRAGDALHLAVCARNATTLCTADETVASAASTLGLPVALVK